MTAYKMQVEDLDDVWWEESRLLKNCDSLQQAQEIAADIVNRFNRSLRLGESPRRLVDVQETVKQKELLP